MVSLSYTQSHSRERRSSSSGDISSGVKLNWRLLAALGINVVIWVGMVKLLGYML